MNLVEAIEGLVGHSANPDYCEALDDVLSLMAVAKPWWLFADYEYYPRGGLADKIGEYATLAEAEVATVGKSWDTIQIVNIYTGEVVEKRYESE